VIAIAVVIPLIIFIVGLALVLLSWKAQQRP
jgi:hypothetical protein